MWSDVADLVKIEDEPDDDAYINAVEVKRNKDVFINVKSVRRSEFYAAMQAGVTVSITFEVRTADYDGETIVEYKHPGKKAKTIYRVVRTFTPDGGDTTELNCSIEKSPASVGRGRRQ